MTDTRFQYIDGEWLDGDSDDELTIRDPAAPDDPIVSFAGASRNQATAAVHAADAAAETWAATTPDERERVMYAVADRIDDHHDALARTLTREEGKPLSSSRAEVGRAAELFRFFANFARSSAGDTLPSTDPETITYTVREPLGTVALVTPWNFPIATPTWKLAAAIATGNTAVFKPSSETPMIARALVEHLEAAGLPDGVVNLVVGSGSTVGDEILTDPRIDGVSFTGSTDVGRHIAETVAHRGIPIQTEMGGKNPQVVLPDADVEAAADAAAAGAFGLTGQACTATSRLIVHEAVAEEVTDAVVARAEDTSVGPGMEDPDMGPAVSAAQDDTNFRYIELAAEEGANLLTGGGRPEGGSTGYFVEPTVFAGVDPEMRIAQEEVFGPVLSILTVSDFEEALAVANGVEYGLSASVFTGDMRAARTFAERIEAGVVKINGTTTGSQIQMPFGGMKSSSSETQKELGHRAYEFYTHEKAVYRTDP